MSSNPPLSAFTDSRKRQQEATEAFTPGIVKIDGTDYVCATKVAARTIELGDGGFKDVLGFAVSLDKTLFPAQPTIGNFVEIDGLSFKITEVNGLNAYDTAWVFRGMRTPGQDPP